MTELDWCKKLLNYSKINYEEFIKNNYIILKIKDQNYRKIDYTYNLNGSCIGAWLYY
jgi:phosphoribosylformylglycinamidine (FGAM) synthase-like amidotransferase family enzyme